MLFEETIHLYQDQVEAAVDQLFEIAFKIQVAENDLLLVLENGLKMIILKHS
jgi:hypothetical protein